MLLKHAKIGSWINISLSSIDDAVSVWIPKVEFGAADFDLQPKRQHAKDQCQLANARQIVQVCGRRYKSTHVEEGALFTIPHCEPNMFQKLR